MEELMEILRSGRHREALTPEKRIRDFLMEIQRKPNGEEVEVRGFVLLRKPPNSPDDALYYLLSPIAPSEIRKARKVMAYLVLRIDESTKIERLHPGEYVVVRGVLDAYPFGNLRLLRVEEIRAESYSHYWKQYSGLALSRGELEDLIRETVYANYEVELAVIYTLLNAPLVLGAEYWREGVAFSTFAGISKKRAVLSMWEVLKYLHSLLPWEVKLKREKWDKVDDNFIGLDFKYSRPSTIDLSYYVPYNRSILRREVPVPKWALSYFEEKRASFMTPRLRMNPGDEAATLSETPFVLTEEVGYEKNPELERLMPNLIATVFIARERLGMLNLLEMGDYRKRFEAFVMRNRLEHGELFDALTISGKVFNVNLRYRLGARLLGSMARFEGKLRRGLISDLLGVYQEIVDTWINELPEDEKIKLLREYERYVGTSRLAEISLRIFSDLESTSSDGLVSKEEFKRTLVEYGFNEGHALRIIGELLREGYLYEPSPGRLKLIRW
ncbi:hypothetical protein [Thermococcus sp.]